MRNNLYDAIKNILHFHSCEQEGLPSGQPSFSDWLNAYDDLSNELNYHDHTVKMMKDSVKLWGVEAQKMMIVEECSELITAISHQLRGRQSNVEEEIADAEIVLEQARVIFDSKKIDEIKKEKLDRLNKRIIKAKQL